MVGGFVGEWACSAAAQSAYAADSAWIVLKVLTERVDFTVRHIPALGRHLIQLPNIVDGRTILLLLGIVVAGLVAEYAVRLTLNRARLACFDRLVGHSPLRAFGRAILLDLVAVVALFIVATSCWPASAMRRASAPARPAGLPGDALLARLQSRVPRLAAARTPEGRIAPVDDAAARGLLVALNWMVVLPADRRPARLAPYQYRRREGRRQRRRHPLRAVRRGGLLWVVWHWRNEMATWLTAMVPSTRSAGSSSSTRRAAGGYSAWPSTSPWARRPFMPP